MTELTVPLEMTSKVREGRGWRGSSRRPEALDVPCQVSFLRPAGRSRARYRAFEHFRRGSSSKPDGKGKEEEVKVVKTHLLWMDQMSQDITEGLHRVQDLREVVEAVQKGKAAL
jgi:hypothetical protein